MRYVIPADLDFSDLKLKVGPDEKIEYDREVVERVCLESGIDPAALMGDGRHLSNLLAAWYRHHRLNGGAPDAVAEPLYAETEVMPPAQLRTTVRAIDPETLSRALTLGLPEVRLDGDVHLTAAEAAALVGQTRQAIAYWHNCGYLAPIEGASPAKYRKADVLAASNRPVRAGRPKKS